MKGDRGARRRMAQLSAGLIVALVGLYAAAIVYIVGRGKAVDFSLYYIAAYGFAQGEDIYRLGGERGPDSAAVWERLAKETGVGDYAPPYRYPPLTAALVWPLTYLPPQTAVVLWLAASAVALIASAWFLGRAGGTPFGVPLALTLLFAFGPALLTLYAGQVNAFVLLSLSWALYAATRGKLGCAGAWVAIGAMLKLVPVAHLAYFGWCRQWRAVAVGLTVLVVCLVVPLPLVGWHSLASYARHFGVLGAAGSVSTAAGNQSLSGFFARFLVAHDNPWHLVDAPQLAWWLARLCSLLFIVATVALCTPVAVGTDTFRLQFALVTTAVTLVPPYLWYHQLVLLLLPLCVLSEYCVIHRSERWMLAPLAIGYIATGTFGLAWRSLQHPVLASMPLYTTILLWALLARLLTRGPNETGALS